MVISKLSKRQTSSVISKSSALAAAEENTAKEEEKEEEEKKKSKKLRADQVIAYYKIPVNFEITGNFIGYIKFKRAVSLSKKC